jgi:hypothetical protein
MWPLDVGVDSNLADMITKLVDSVNGLNDTAKKGINANLNIHSPQFEDLKSSMKGVDLFWPVVIVAVASNLIVR